MFTICSKFLVFGFALSVFGATGPAQTELVRLLTTDDGAVPDHPCGERNLTTLSRFYQSDPVLQWTTDERPSRQALKIISILKSAGAEGLEPDDYESTQWDARLKALPMSGPREIAKFDISLTGCVLQYAADIRFGRARSSPVPDDFVLQMRESLPAANDPAKILESLEPPFPGYRRLLQMLTRYRALAANDDGTKLPTVRKSVKPGDRWEGIIGLARLLTLTGDLAPDAKPDSDIYQRPLVTAVSRFQRLHGLDPDGVIGTGTIASLNVPFSQRVRQIELTLERWREAPREFSRPPIVVNIPEFSLHALGPQYETELQMKVITGRAFGHQTPIFSGDMTYLVFRPYWDVPFSISKKEILPKLRKDPQYLAKNHFEVVDKFGHVENPNAVDLSARLGSGDWRVRQMPGGDNALGEVKFMFPNSHNVYLHGTPAPGLFSKSRRDFSHGCIRVEKPPELAEWVLRGKPEWTPAGIRAAMDGADPVRVNLKESIPVLIVYGTSLVNESGEVFFFNDIYGIDAALGRTLTARRVNR